MKPSRRKQLSAAAQRERFGKLLTETLLDAILEALPDLIGRTVDGRLANLRTLRHVGVWDRERQYQEQECVTSDGSMWVARAEVTGLKPGTDAGAASWQLVVKRGKDGRDGLDGKDAVGACVQEVAET